MIASLFGRIVQGHRTIKYPKEAAALPERYRGVPRIDTSKCAGNCAACSASCPVAAITTDSGKASLDLGRCLFCGTCAAACPRHAIEFTREHRMAAGKRGELIIDSADTHLCAAQLEPALRRILGRSLRLRQVSAGGCNACEADTNVLGTITYDIVRFGIDFVASPRHADGLLVTGPVSKNMELALRKTYEAVPAPKIVIAAGACAISGGMFSGHEEVAGGVAEIIPVDLFIPGCPPHPLTILDGLLGLLGRACKEGTR